MSQEIGKQVENVSNADARSVETMQCVAKLEGLVKSIVRRTGSHFS